MTSLFQKAVAAVEKLPDDEQDTVAALILEEIADEDTWTGSFARSQDPLARLADEARADVRGGRAKDGGWDEE